MYILMHVYNNVAICLYVCMYTCICLHVYLYAKQKHLGRKSEKSIRKTKNFNLVSGIYFIKIFNSLNDSL